MTSRYGSPAAFKHALEARLRDRAGALGMDLGRLRQLLVFERFAARLAAAFGDRLILKGGFVVELRLARARTTKDLDVRMIGDPDETLDALREAGRLDLDDYLTFIVEADPRRPEIDAEGMIYEGRRYRARATMVGKIYGAHFGVDVAFAEPIVGDVEEVRGSDLLAFAQINTAAFRVYPLEAHIAEKLHALTMPRSRPNSRVKDLPDVCLLAQAREVEARVLRSAIETTFASRGTHPVPIEMPAPPEAWTPVYKRMATVDELPWPNLDHLTRAARAFMDPVLADEVGTWSPTAWAWK